MTKMTVRQLAGAILECRNRINSGRADPAAECALNLLMNQIVDVPYVNINGETIDCFTLIDTFFAPFSFSQARRLLDYDSKAIAAARRQSA